MIASEDDDGRADHSHTNYHAANGGAASRVPDDLYDWAVVVTSEEVHLGCEATSADVCLSPVCGGGTYRTI